MTDREDKLVTERETDISKGPVGGQGRTAPRPDPVDGDEIDALTRERQPNMGPKG
jgi:hypothetical protein